MSFHQLKTVREWETATDTNLLIDALHRGRFLRRNYPKSQRRRKLRLYCCALARTLRVRLRPEERRAIAVAEAFADDFDFSHNARRAEARLSCWWAIPRPTSPRPGSDDPGRRLGWRWRLIQTCAASNRFLHDEAHAAAWAFASAACEDFSARSYEEARPYRQNCISRARSYTVEVFRDVLRCPFLPIMSPSHVPADLRDWALSIYDGRAYEELPVLGDALEEAGCDDFGLLEHLRGAGPHHRGCWALDRVLGFV